MAAGLIALGAAKPDAGGQVWHLPVAETWTTRQVIEHVYGLAGTKPKVFAAGRTTLRLYGLVNPAVREYLHTLYFSDNWLVDCTKFRTRFGTSGTPLPDALAATFDWYAKAWATGPPERA